VLESGAWLGGTEARFMDLAGALCFVWEHQVVHAYAAS
jgi:hypothetical protein